MHCLGWSWPTWMLTLSYFFLTTIMEGEQICPRTTLFWLRFLGVQGYQQKGWFRLGLVCWSFHHSVKVADNLRLIRSSCWFERLPKKPLQTPVRCVQEDASRALRLFHQIPCVHGQCRAGMLLATALRLQQKHALVISTCKASWVCQLAGEEKLQVFFSFFFGLKRHKILEIRRGSRICMLESSLVVFFGARFIVFFLIHSILKNSCSFGQGPDTNKNPASSNKTVTQDPTSWEV